MSVLVGLIVMLGMFVVVPMGLGLIDGPPQPALRLLRRAWPLLALPGAVALWLPRSALAATLAAVYALATFALALCAPARLAATLPQPSAGGAPISLRSLAPPEVAVLTALATPSVAGLALVAERAGHELLGFDLDILALTVPHFHFAGFAAALVAGLVSRTTEGAATRFAALSVPLGTLLVLIGYFVDDWAELAGALVLTAGMWAVALPTWRELRTGAPDPVTRGLLAVSSVVLVATMLLALSWALGEATGLPHPDLAWMAATHGLGNALGFALCSLLAWRRLRATAPSTAPLKETASWPV
ncbi:YndJ family protein [Streptomyces vilmorinianum]|uniref:YndJ family protein n=1 Tax=Streptomyces vilmorinianum TaxID=3051092 RepID=UPI0010FB6483|nr:YndJ family protein [Streptomyces vilmorinianum]